MPAKHRGNAEKHRAFLGTEQSTQALYISLAIFAMLSTLEMLPCSELRVPDRNTEYALILWRIFSCFRLFFVTFRWRKREKDREHRATLQSGEAQIAKRMA